MLTWLQVKLLNCIAPPANYAKGPAPAAHHSGLLKLRRQIGDRFLNEVKGKIVIDFGCGQGFEAVALAQAGAKHVIGIESRASLREYARELAAQSGVSDRCTFVAECNEKADVVLSLDAFEHFDDPARVLRLMHQCLAPGGEVVAAFGYPWLHPLGGHLFSVFPWAHLLFSEKALIDWRSQFSTDNARRFSEVDGGLNQMTVARFERLVNESPLRFSELELVPIRALRFLHTGLTREFVTSFVRCRMKAAESRPILRPVVTPADRIPLPAASRSGLPERL